MLLDNDTDTVVFHTLRVFRNSFIDYTRARLTPVYGEFLDKEIEQLNDPGQGHKVYTPVKIEEKQRQRGQDPFAPREGESPELTEWRTRMGTQEAKEIYKERASTAECVNALARQRGLQQFAVRGLPKVRAVAIWFVLAHNLCRWRTLRAEGELKVKGR